MVSELSAWNYSQYTCLLQATKQRLQKRAHVFPIRPCACTWTYDVRYIYIYIYIYISNHGHSQTAKFKFANILVSRFSDKIAKFFARQYFGVYGIYESCVAIQDYSATIILIASLCVKHCITELSLRVGSYTLRRCRNR